MHFCDLNEANCVWDIDLIRIVCEGVMCWKEMILSKFVHWFRSPFPCNVNWNYFITKHTAGKVILRHLFFILHQIDRFMINPQKLFVLRVFVVFTFSLIWCQIFFSLLFFLAIKKCLTVLETVFRHLEFYWDWDGNRIVCILNENSPFF